MPRGSKKSANPHNNRHENGVVAPGKRIVKQKSAGHLNGGSPDGRQAADNYKVASPVPTLPASSPGAVARPVNGAGAASSSGPRGPASSAGRAQAATARPHVPHAARPNGISAPAASTANRKDSRTYKEDPIDDHRVNGLDAIEGADGYADLANRQSSANVARAFPGSSLPLPLTVLLSCPLRDTLAMLILLLSIPPVLVTATNSIFAVMTFVPPSGSFTVLPTLSDITSSFSPTTPSFLVTCLIDIIAMSVWIWIPFPALQAFFLDAAQAMVATTLGGGSGQRPGAHDNTLVSVSVVVATHLARYRSLLLKPFQDRLGHLAHLVGEFDGSYVYSYPIEADRNWWGTFKVFLALHIFCQGMTGMVRRRLNTPRQSVTSATTPRGMDSDASHVLSTGTDMLRHVSNPLSPADLRPRPSLQNLRESHRDRLSSGKRRRKQANFVRAHQPFWAAVAGTKTTVMREYETNRANKDAVSSHATNSDNLGNAPFMASEHEVWITEIKDAGFFFETGSLTFSPPAVQDDHEGAKDEGVDRSKPLYVRCNKTDWVSMRMVPVPDSGEEHRHRWVGEVYGLSAGRTYHVAFVKSEDDEVVLAQTILTQALSVNPVSPAPTESVFSPIRPSSPASPTATLKSSIASHETRLAELDDQARRGRKDNKGTLASLNRELDGLNDRLQSHSSTDDNLQSRLTHLVQHKKQLEEATEAIGTELENFELLPQDKLQEYETRRSSLDRARQRQSAAQNDLYELRKANKASLDGRREHEMGLRHKAERLQARLRAIAARHAKLTEPEFADGGGTGAQRSGSESSARVLDRAMLCAKYEEDIAALSHEFQLKTMRLNHLSAQVNTLAQSMAQAEQQQHQQHNVQHLALQHQHHTSNLSSNPQAQLSLRLQSDNELSRPTTPDLLPSSSGIGTGFGRNISNGGGGGNGDVGSAGFAPSAAWYTPDSASFAPIPPLNGSSRFTSQRTRRRSASGLSQDSSSYGINSAGLGGSITRDGNIGVLFHPDDDDLVPTKIKRRSGYGNAYGSPAYAPGYVATPSLPFHPHSGSNRNGSRSGSGTFPSPGPNGRLGEEDDLPLLASGSPLPLPATDGRDYGAESGSGEASAEGSAMGSGSGSGSGDAPGSGYSSAHGTGSGKGSPGPGS